MKTRIREIIGWAKAIPSALHHHALTWHLCQIWGIITWRGDE